MGQARALRRRPGEASLPRSRSPSEPRTREGLNHVKSIGSLHSTTRTPDQTEIARFWFESLDTWNRIANSVIRKSFDATSTTLPGVTRRFNRFSQAARETRLSRVYGGIHFLRAIADGAEEGRRIGRAVGRKLPRVDRRPDHDRR
jgi:hypothetical protein